MVMEHVKLFSSYLAFRVIFALWLLMLSPARAFATDEELDRLLQMDLAELTVSVASKRAENIDDAPAIINANSHIYGFTAYHRWQNAG
jgi:hypothetical protein